MGLGCKGYYNAHKRKTSADGRRKGKIKQTKGIPDVKKDIKSIRDVVRSGTLPLEVVDVHA